MGKWDKPELSWSISRYDMFKKCKRKYYFNYYGYWNGWSIKAPKRTREIYYCKNIKTFDMILGLIIHNAAKKCWGNNNINMREDLISEGIKEWNKILDETKRKFYLNRKSIGVLEFVEGVVDENTFNNMAVHKIESCVNNLISYLDNSKIDINSIFILDDFDNGYFDFDINNKSIKVWAVIDLGYWDRNKIKIVDWKTGEEKFVEANFKNQMLTYGLWCLSRKDYVQKEFIVEDIGFEIVKLNTGEVFNFKCVEKDYNDLLDLIEVSFNEMLMLDDKIENDFKMVEDFKDCENCNFKTVCPKFKMNYEKINVKDKIPF